MASFALLLVIAVAAASCPKETTCTTPLELSTAHLLSYSTLTLTNISQSTRLCMSGSKSPIEALFSSSARDIEAEAEECEHFYKSSSLLFWKESTQAISIHFSPFQRICYKVEVPGPSCLLQIQNASIAQNILLPAIATILFLLAPPLSRSAVAFYTTSFTFGAAFTVVLLVAFIFHKLLNRGALATLGAASASAAALVATLSADAAAELLRSPVFVAVALLGGGCAFAWAYVSGPPSVRGQQLIQWSLQGGCVVALMAALTTWHSPRAGMYRPLVDPLPILFVVVLVVVSCLLDSAEAVRKEKED
jgi:hypothetical protein